MAQNLIGILFLRMLRHAPKIIRQIRTIGENREILIVDRDTDEATEKLSKELGTGIVLTRGLFS